ncbi:MAG: methionine--tRNA ligase [Candidatus Shikimatogenerans sp. AspAUS03]|uniref:Methionine--tRNA ligase n=1 Tax=Candidatus Shikimatogenerans sp. AspAUS03 TaxID=3158563 RepID=A0AAU7QTE6_9FLAO
MKKLYIITAALPYANGPIHIGHLSGVYLPSDLYVKFLKFLSKKVIFISGSDEYGVNILIKSKLNKTSPKYIVNKYYKINRSIFKKFNINFDHFIRTTNKKHHLLAKYFFFKMKKEGDIIKKKTYQFFDPLNKEYLPDKYIEGVCKYCLNKSNLDICENCGKFLFIKDIKLPKSILNKNKLYIKSTINWCLKLKDNYNFLYLWLKSKKKKWKTITYKYAFSFLKSIIKYKSITRDLKWGIPIYKNKVLYVWFEALIAYLSVFCKDNIHDYKYYWNNKYNKIIQFIGKDNIIFHTIIFPIILKNLNLKLPNIIVSNEFLNYKNKKISTSKNYGIFCDSFLKNKNNNKDYLRFFLIYNMPENKDYNYITKNFVFIINKVLINIIGNLFNRVISLLKMKKKCKINFFVTSKNIIYIFCKNILKKIKKNILKFKFKNSLYKYINLAIYGNKYFTKKKIWKYYQNSNYLNNILIIIYFLIQLMFLYLPFNSKKILKNFNIKQKKYNSLKKIRKIKFHIKKYKKLFKKI